MPALLIGDARIYVDHGLTGCNQERPGLREALADCPDGDTLVVTKLDRLARSLADARRSLDGWHRRSGRQLGTAGRPQSGWRSINAANAASTVSGTSTCTRKSRPAGP